MIKLMKLCEKYGLTAEEIQEIFETPICPMYGIISTAVEKRFTIYSKRGEYISRYAQDDDSCLEEAIEELFMTAGYDTNNYSIMEECLFTSSSYDTGFCAISWISKVTGELEAFSFQWEAM